MKVLKNIAASFLLAVKANLGISRKIPEYDDGVAGAYYLEGVPHAIVWNVLIAGILSFFVFTGDIQITAEITSEELIAWAFFFAIFYPIVFVGFVFQIIREIFGSIGSYLLKE